MTGIEFLIAATIIGAVGSVVQGIQARQQARFQERVARQNAEIAIAIGERNAKAAIIQAAAEEERFRLIRRRQISAARAAFGSAGVQVEGTPLEVLADQARMAEQDALLVRHQGTVAAENARLGALLDARRSTITAIGARQRGQQALVAGFVNAGSTLLTGFDEVQQRKQGDPVL